MMIAVPTARDEAWRYSDHKAVARLWPLAAPERIALAAGERLEKIIEAGTDSICQLDLTLAAGASAHIHGINLGGGYGRIEVTVTLHSGAHFSFDGIQLGDGDETREIVVLVRHVEPGATSRQSVRTVLNGKATGTFLGKIYVAKGAQQTDAEQSSKALLLTRTATANTKPELEIHADDVKCAHGATVGELDKNALFYLQARGLSPDEARNLLIEAFMADLVDAITNDAERARIGALVSARLSAMVRS
jgi:Fe-S cluster assembly protein SufD